MFFTIMQKITLDFDRQIEIIQSMARQLALPVFLNMYDYMEVLTLISLCHSDDSP